MAGALLAGLPAVRSDHPCLPEARHLPAFFLVTQKRHAEALEQFRLIDGCIGSLPWSCFEGTPRKGTAITGNEPFRAPGSHFPFSGAQPAPASAATE
ncbi:hypothetical protein IPZ58_06285 [Streptomyces roseoverticillatus]|nr:hypothetical protein [Streptomyces roseoverticillatus]